MTKAEAKARATWWRRARFAKMSAYRCSRCLAWHVGHHSLSGRRKTRR